MANEAQAPTSGKQVSPSPANAADIPAKALASNDVCNQSAAKKQEPATKMGVWMIGEVMRATPGNYDLLVKTPEATDLICKYAPGELARYMGAKNCSLPPEGSIVLVYQPHGAVDAGGIVLATVPRTLQGVGGPGGNIQKPVKMYAQQLGDENGAGLASLQSMNVPTSDANNSKKLFANENRPLDILPGDLAWINDAGGMLGLLTFMSVIGSSERARIETYVFDDLVRVVSGNWQHWHSMGDTAITNDNGYSTLEMAGSWFYPETIGEKTFQTAALAEQDKKAETMAQGSYQFKTKPDSARMARRRFQIYMGALGDMFQLFLANPSDGDVETMESTPDRRSMLHCSVKGSGEVCLRSAAGFSFERNDCLPNPKRTRNPEDPEGTVVDENTAKKKLPYKYSDKHRFARNLAMRDAEAWERAQDLQRFDEVDKDFHTPEESVLHSKAPDDKYDPQESEFPFAANKGRKAGFRVGEDGSVHIYDAWGGEIYMAGGVIHISAPGAVVSRSGGSIVNLGKQVILKAKNSVDVTAEDHDVRIAAKGNIHVHTREKGILLESSADKSSHNFYEGINGEQANSAGIVLKAAKSPVFLWGRDVVLFSESNVFIQALQKGGGQLVMSVKSIIGVGEKIILTAASSASLILSRGMGALLGRQALLAGQSAAGVHAGGQMMVPFDWAASTDVYSIMQGRYGNGIYSRYYSQEAWMNAFKTESRAPIKFTYRSTDDYGTGRPMEVDPQADKFRLYESLWQHELVKDRNPFMSGEQDKWKETAVNGTYPWPGANARKSAYDTMSAYAHVLAGEAHYASKARGTMADSEASFETKSMDEYIVRK